jgi:hypothetical protein
LKRNNASNAPQHKRPSLKRPSRTGNQAERSSGNAKLKLERRLRREKRENALRPYLRLTKRQTADHADPSTLLMLSGKRSEGGLTAAAAARVI